MACIDSHRRPQDRDNYIWIQDAENRLVVGTQARILIRTPKAGGTLLLLLTKWCEGKSAPS